MITRVHIDNFRCFSNFELEANRTNLLIGANGSGKSSFIDLITRVLALVVNGHGAETLFSADDLTRWDERLRQRFEIDARIRDASYRYEVVVEHDPGRSQASLKEERVSCGDRTLFVYADGKVHLHNNQGVEGTSFPFRGVRSFLAQIEERPETTDLKSFLDHLRRIHAQKLNPIHISSTSHEENQTLDTDGANFASWYRHVSQERAADLQGLFDKLRKAIPEFRALSLKGAGKQGRTRDLVAELMSPDTKPYEIDFDALSDGQRALIILYTLLIAHDGGPQVLLIDEPENYVGLAEIQPWLVELDDALGDEGQLFVISHHPEAIDFLAAEHPILFERPDGGPVRLRKTVFERDSGLKASEQIARGLIHGQ
jgi:predicted ATPase